MRDLDEAVRALCNPGTYCGAGATGDRFRVGAQDVRVAVVDARREALEEAASLAEILIGDDSASLVPGEIRSLIQDATAG